MLLNSEEFFAVHLPELASARNSAERDALILTYERNNDPAIRAYREEQRRVAGEAHFIRKSGLYPLTGYGRINTFSLFAESEELRLGRSGAVGVITSPSCLRTGAPAPTSAGDDRMPREGRAQAV